MECIIIGAGGHSHVIRDILELRGYHIKGYYDDNISNDNILGKIDELELYENVGYICGIGDNNIRKKITNKFKNLNWISAIHPSAIISSDVNIGKGNVICAGAIIQPGTIIKDHIIINTRASIDHHNIISDYCHIGPGVILCGGVKIFEKSFIGAGSTIIDDIIIGKNVIIGAHSLLIKNIDNGIKICGVPANKILNQTNLT